MNQNMLMSTMDAYRSMYQTEKICVEQLQDKIKTLTQKAHNSYQDGFLAGQQLAYAKQLLRNQKTNQAWIKRSIQRLMQSNAKVVIKTNDQPPVEITDKKLRVVIVGEKWIKAHIERLAMSEAKKKVNSDGIHTL